jgi:hypothetical protein
LHGQKILLLTIWAALLFSDLSSAFAFHSLEMPTHCWNCRQLLELPPFFHVQSQQHLVLQTSTPFSVWTLPLPSLPKPRGWGSLTDWLSHRGFGWVQKVLLTTCLKQQIQWNKLAFWMIQHLKPTLKSVIVSAIKFCLLQNESIYKCDFQTSEVKPPAPASFSFAELSFHFHEISTNQLAFWMFQHLKPTLKKTIVYAIEFCSRRNQFRSEPFKPVKSKHQDRPFSICWTSIPIPWNFNGPTSFLNVLTSQTDIEECHNFRHQILL